MRECVMFIAKHGDRLWSLRVWAVGSSGSVLLRWKHQTDTTSPVYTHKSSPSPFQEGGGGYQNRLHVANWIQVSFFPSFTGLMLISLKKGFWAQAQSFELFLWFPAWRTQTCAQDFGPVSLCSFLWDGAGGALRGTLQRSHFSVTSSFPPIL